MTFELSPSFPAPEPRQEMDRLPPRMLAALSPSIIDGASMAEEPAYELKFRLPEGEAARVEAWARQRLTADPHGRDGAYATTSLYCDTPLLDVFHRSPGYKRSKYRLRRYESSGVVYLERKRRKGDRVAKRRDSIALGELPLLGGADVSLDWAGQWFYRQLRFRDLRPSCWIHYQRTAFMGGSLHGPVRLTLDREVSGVPAADWHVPCGLEGARELLPGSVVLELKFRAALPAVFRDLLTELPARVGGVSKYRLCVEAWGLPAREV
jgi:hypothetical protein